MTIYADEIFLVNTLSDALLLYSYTYIAGAKPRHGRMLGAAAAGGLYSAFEAALALPQLLRAGVLFGLAYLAFGRAAVIKHTVKLMLMCFIIESITLTAVSAIGAGAALARGGIVIFASEPVSAALFIGAYPAYILIMKLFAKRRKYLRLRLTYRGRIAELDALSDSGNLLKYHNKPVIMAAWDSVGHLFDSTCYEELKNKSDSFVMYHTVSGAGILPVIEPEKCEADGAEVNAAVAVVSRKFKGRYSAIAGEFM